MREVGGRWDTPLIGGRNVSAVWDMLMAGAPGALEEGHRDCVVARD